MSYLIRVFACALIFSSLSARADKERKVTDLLAFFSKDLSKTEKNIKKGIAERSCKAALCSLVPIVGWKHLIDRHYVSTINRARKALVTLGSLEEAKKHLEQSYIFATTEQAKDLEQIRDFLNKIRPSEDLVQSLALAKEIVVADQNGMAGLFLDVKAESLLGYDFDKALVDRLQRLLGRVSRQETEDQSIEEQPVSYDASAPLLFYR